MIQTGFCIITRIVSNSYLNVFQKILTAKGAHSSVINLYTYAGLTVLALLILFLCKYNVSGICFNNVVLYNFGIMGLLGALGNYFIIKALSVGELSSLAPINSYKPVISMIFAFYYLGEVPSFCAATGILLIILGTYIIYGAAGSANKIAVIYRTLALIFSGTEAVFIKRIILLTNVPISFFLWAFSGFIFAALFVYLFRVNKFKTSLKEQVLLIIFVGIMQYSTNYVFEKINVSYALALFQLSTILSVFLGVNIFKEQNLKQKLIASVIMFTGAVIIILN